MKQYQDMLQYILDNGVERKDRTGTGTIGVFGYQNRYDISEKFPLLTTKRVFWRGVVHELLWFLQGRDRRFDGVGIDYLLENDIHIWDAWAKDVNVHKRLPNGNAVFPHEFETTKSLGPVYGAQWRSWPDHDSYERIGSIDQIANVIKSIKENPWSRRHIVSAWNVSELDDMALPPCHLLFQFNVRPDEDGKPTYLDCQLYQRSADVFLGVPFNIASYSLLTYMIASVTGLKPGEFIHTFGDLHIYSNHVDQVKEQLSREPRELPTLVINPMVEGIDGFKFSDFILNDYNPDKTIKAEISV